MLETKRKLFEMKDEHERLVKSHSELVQKYQTDMEKSDMTVKLLRDQMNNFSRTAEQMRQDRDAALQQSREEHREVALLGDKLIEMMKKQQREMDDILSKNREHMHMLQTQWDAEREKLHQEIRDLKRSRADLQLEIGWLLRDKQSAQSEVGQILRSLDSQRDRFRREIMRSPPLVPSPRPQKEDPYNIDQPQHQ